MHQVTIHEAKTHLSKLIQEALSGEEVVIAKRDKPVVMLTPIPSNGKVRKPGIAKGMIEISDDFNDPLEDFSDFSE